MNVIKYIHTYTNTRPSLLSGTMFPDPDRKLKRLIFLVETLFWGQCTQRILPTCGNCVLDGTYDGYTELHTGRLVRIAF